MSYASVVLADNPIFFARCNGAAAGTTLTDSSGHGRDGAWGTDTLAAASLILTDPANGAATVPLANGRGTVPAAGWMAGLGAVTLECWFKTNHTGLGGLVGDSVAGAFGSSAAGHYRVYHNNGALTFQVFDTTWNPIFTLTAGAGLNNDAPHHVVASWNGANAWLFADGAQIGTVAGAGAMSASLASPLQIGAMGNNFPLTDQIDEVAIYDTALTAADALAHFTAGTVEPSLSAFVGDQQVVAAYHGDVPVSNLLLG